MIGGRLAFSAGNGDELPLPGEVADFELSQRRDRFRQRDDAADRHLERPLTNCCCDGFEVGGYSLGDHHPIRAGERGTGVLRGGGVDIEDAASALHDGSHCFR